MNAQWALVVLWLEITGLQPCLSIYSKLLFAIVLFSCEKEPEERESKSVTGAKKLF